MKNNRIIWIDWAKALLIYLMVVGHCFPVKWQGQLIYAFHMPAFFIISGFLYHHHDWKKTLKSFLVPILFFSTINFFIYALPKLIKGTFSTNHLLERILVPFWGSGNLSSEDYITLFPGVWFIIVLMFSRLLIGDIKVFAFVTRFWKFITGLLITFLVIEPYFFPCNPLHAYKWFLVVPSLPFILMGYGFHDRLILFIQKMRWRLFVVGFILFGMISLWNGWAEILHYQWGKSYIVFCVNACLGSILLFYLCSKFNGNRIVEVFSKGTLLILAFNFVLRAWLSMLFEKMGFGFVVNDHYVFPWIMGLLIMLICYWPIKLLLRIFPLLLGK